jgi:hypothetical protein
VMVPDELDAIGGLKATAVVELPFHVRWSEPSFAYDLRIGGIAAVVVDGGTGVELVSHGFASGLAKT